MSVGGHGASRLGRALGSWGEWARRTEQWGKGRQAVFSGCISCRLLGDQRKAGKGLSWGQATHRTSGRQDAEPDPMELERRFEDLQETDATICTKEGERVWVRGKA